MKRKLVLPIVAINILMAAACSRPAYYPPPPPPSPALGAIAQQAYNDGVAAASRDLRRGLPPDPSRHPRFRRPPVPPPAFEDYRHGFRDGYEQVFRHGPPPGR